MAKANLMTGVTPLCQALADSMGLELVEVALDKESAGKYLRIYLDCPEGLDMNRCEAFHRAILPQLEDYDYDFLEVSSPGVDRPLKTQRDFDKHEGEQVEVRLYKPLNGKKLLEGVLIGLDDGTIRVETPEGVLELEQKTVALIKPLVDMDGVDEVEL